METTRTTIGVAMVGGGLMAKAHTMAWRNVQAVYGDLGVDIELLWLVDATQELADRAALQFGFTKATTSWEEAIADPRVVVVDIVTPNFLHRDVVIAAARAGKHLWCEKPLASTLADGEKMARVAEESGVVTLMGFSYLRNPGVALAKELIAAGKIGEVVSFSGTFAIDAMTDPDTPFTWRQERALAGSGALGDLGSHTVAFAEYLVGPLAEVAAATAITVADRPLPTGTAGYGESAAVDAPRRAVENDDISMVLGRFGNGALATLEASRVSSGRSYDVNFTITGTHGAIQFDQQHMYRLRVRTVDDDRAMLGFRDVDLGPGHGGFGELWPVAGVNISVHDLKIFEVHDLIQAILAGTSAFPDFAFGLRVERVLDAVERADQERTWVRVFEG